MNWDKIPKRRYKPEFENLLKVLRREIPDHPVLFGFYFNERLYRRTYGK